MKKTTSFHKAFFLVLMVVAPLYWLTLTDDGQRRVDSVLLSLAGKPAIDFNLKALDNRLTEKELREVFADQDWQCVDQTSPFGQRLCASEIGSFNGLPARYLTVFFAGAGASAVKVAYRAVYHDQLTAQLVQQFGQPESAVPNQAPGESLLSWRTDHGVVVLKRILLENEEPALLWLAGDAR